MASWLDSSGLRGALVRRRSCQNGAKLGLARGRLVVTLSRGLAQDFEARASAAESRMEVSARKHRARVAPPPAREASARPSLSISLQALLGRIQGLEGGSKAGASDATDAVRSAVHQQQCATLARLKELRGTHRNHASPGK